MSAGQLLPVPEGLKELDAALIEPTAVAVHVNRRAAVPQGCRVAVVGTGVIGTLVAQVARVAGASEVVVADRLESRKEFLEGLGFGRFVHVGEGESAAELASKIGSVDLMFDCVCVDTTVEAGLDALTPGGRLVLVGVAAPGDHRLSVPYAKVYSREITLVASRNYVPDDFVEAMRLMANGEVDVSPLITGVCAA